VKKINHFITCKESSNFLSEVCYKWRLYIKCQSFT